MVRVLSRFRLPLFLGSVPGFGVRGFCRLRRRNRGRAVRRHDNRSSHVGMIEKAGAIAKGFGDLHGLRLRDVHGGEVEDQRGGEKLRVVEGTIRIHDGVEVFHSRDKEPPACRSPGILGHADAVGIELSRQLVLSLPNSVVDLFDVDAAADVEGTVATNAQSDRPCTGLGFV